MSKRVTKLKLGTDKVGLLKASLVGLGSWRPACLVEQVCFLGIRA